MIVMAYTILSIEKKVNVTLQILSDVYLKFFFYSLIVCLIYVGFIYLLKLSKKISYSKLMYFKVFIYSTLFFQGTNFIFMITQ